MIQEPISLFFHASQRGLNPLRRRGLMGSPEAPIFYAAGDVVPWWVECRWPLNVSVTFLCDCETFWDADAQHVHPLWNDEPGALMKVNGKGQAVLIVGAPTAIWSHPRRRGPKPQSSRPLALA